jgi:translation elongation factor EF-1alpha
MMTSRMETRSMFSYMLRESSSEGGVKFESIIDPSSGERARYVGSAVEVIGFVKEREEVNLLLTAPGNRTL